MGTYNIISVKNILDYKSDILSLWKRYLYDSTDRFDWLYFKNPVGAPHTWIARNEENKNIVGCGSVYPWMFNINEKVYKVGMAVDFAVDTKHRVFGPALSLQRELTSFLKTNDAGYDIFFIYPNNESRGIFQRVGYDLIGSANDWVKVIKSEYVILKFIQNKLISQIIGSFVDTVLSIFDTITNYSSPKGLNIEILNKCDQRFHSLWKRNQFKAIIEPYQDADYLNWRYADCKTAHYSFFCLSNQNDSELECFLVYSVKNGNVVIKDIFPANSKFAAHMLFLFAKQMKAERNSSITISYFGNAYFKKILKKLNFFERDSKRDYLICMSDRVDDKTKNILINKENYVLFYG